MILLVDIGNSALKYLDARALWQGAAPRRISSNGDGLAARLDAAWGELAPPEAVVVACVAREPGEILRRWCVTHWEREPRFLTAAAREAGIINGYTEPAQLGVDRWAALVGARTLGEQDVCIVDAGTAVTVDLLDHEGRHHGGLIMPGVRLLQDAVGQRTGAGVPASPETAGFPGRSTAACLAAGSTLALVATVGEALRQAATVFGAPPRCLICGGDAPVLVPSLREAGVRVAHHPELVLRGIARLAGLAAA